VNIKINSLRKPSEETRRIFLYRYISLLVTSFFFLVNYTEHPIGKRVFIITSIAASAMILNYLYIRNSGSGVKIKLLVLIETIGNSLLLIPSGGINSPFVWYSLNTIAIASIELKKKW